MLKFENSTEGLIKQIREEEPDLETGVWRTISKEAKDLVRSFLEKDPAFRMKISDALNHPWLLPDRNSPLPPPGLLTLTKAMSNSDCMRAFCDKNGRCQRPYFARRTRTNSTMGENDIKKVMESMKTISEIGTLLNESE